MYKSRFRWILTPPLGKEIAFTDLFDYEVTTYNLQYEEDRWIGTREATELLGEPVAWIYKQRRKGLLWTTGIECVKIGGRLKFRKSTITRFKNRLSRSALQISKES